MILVVIKTQRIGNAILYLLIFLAFDQIESSHKSNCFLQKDLFNIPTDCVTIMVLGYKMANQMQVRIKEQSLLFDLSKAFD